MLWLVTGWIPSRMGLIEMNKRRGEAITRTIVSLVVAEGYAARVGVLVRGSGNQWQTTRTIVGKGNAENNRLRSTRPRAPTFIGTH
jgi:hypothetical protein